VTRARTGLPTPTELARAMFRERCGDYPMLPIQKTHWTWRARRVLRILKANRKAKKR
jgi:hypothetical protein